MAPKFLSQSRMLSIKRTEVSRGENRGEYETSSDMEEMDELVQTGIETSSTEGLRKKKKIYLFVIYFKSFLNKYNN